MPLRNRPITAEEQRELKAKAQEIFALCKSTWAGFIHAPDPHAAMSVPKAERLARYQFLHDRGGFSLWLGNYSDSFMSQEAADEVAAFLAQKIRARVKNPAVAEKLIPKHTFGTKRCPGEKDYYEAFNRDNVSLVDLRETPITRITPGGIETTRETHELDVIIYATGFHSLTGELLRMDIRGRGGQSLQEHWSEGPRTNLGIQFSGFPNLWAVMGPHNPAVFCNITRCAENNVEWIVECIRYMREKGFKTMATTREAEDAWTSAATTRLKDFSSIRCVIRGSSAARIRRQSAAIFCCMRAACRSIGGFSQRSQRGGMRVSSSGREALHL